VKIKFETKFDIASLSKFENKESPRRNNYDRVGKMTASDDLDGSDVDILDVDSDVEDCSKEGRKQKKAKKKKKKKKSKRNSGSLSPSSRTSEQQEHGSESAEEDDIISVTSVGDDVTSLPAGDDEFTDNDNTDIHERKSPRSPKKKKKKKKDKAETKENVKKSRKKKEKTGKRPEDDERRRKFLLEQAVKRVSCPEMENPVEMFMVSGDSGVGKTHWIESETHRILLKMREDEDGEEVEDSDDDRCNFLPVICRGTCEIPPRFNNDKSDKDESESSSTSNSPMESFYKNGCGISRPPMHAITEALNDLIRSLTTNNGGSDQKEVWKERIEDALGITEASHLASTGLLPELGSLLNISGLRTLSEKKKMSPTWDWNSPYKFHRSCVAIRDLLRAISESHHPVIMVLRDLHHADKDTYNLLNFLLTGFHSDGIQLHEPGNVDTDDRQAIDQDDEFTSATRLNNFLFVGIHECSPNHPNDMLESLERSFKRSQTSTFEENQDDLRSESEQDHEAEPSERSHIEPCLTKIHMEPFHEGKVHDILRSLILEKKENKIDDRNETSTFKEKLRQLTGLICDWTGGNVFHVSQVVEFLKEVGAITSSSQCKLSIGEAQAHADIWNKSIIGLTAARIDRLPKTVRFVIINLAVFRQTYIEFSVQELFDLLGATYAEKATKRKGEMEFPLQSAADLEKALNLASELGFMKRVLCQRNCNDNNYRWAFAHTIIRDEAYSLFAKKKRKKKIEIHLRLGTKASALAFVPASSDQESSERDESSSDTESNVFKFLAADQLALAEESLKQDCNKAAVFFLETAQMCILKSTFHAAIRYLRVGIGILERNGGRFKPENHGTCVQMYILLARLHSVCDHSSNETEQAFREVIENGKNLKDKFMLHQAEIGISIGQKNYQYALKQVLSTLQLLGEKFPEEVDLSQTVSSEIENLRLQIHRKDNHSLLHPSPCTDKKTFDVMILLCNMLNISRLCKNKAYEEASTIRMMKISLGMGYTAQYSTSFAHYGAILMERSLATNDLDMAKEGYRMGQISEKIARVRSVYGGHSLATIQHYLSHWRRPYRRSLGQILSIYNTQLESGDYFHIPFTTFTYVQYHLACGHNLSKLDDNLQLFDALYHDYKMENHWTIQLPQRLVSNLLGETSDPFIFYGNSIEDQNSRIDQLEKAGENDAVQLLHILILFNAIFFHNLELSKSCLEKITKENVMSIWKPWIIFFECFTDILSLPTIEKKAEKKKLKETITSQRDQLLDWYDQGNINCSFMVSLIDAEFMVTDSAGKKSVPSLRIKKFYDDAIVVAEEQELKHMEAFCLERASMRLDDVGAEELSAEYMEKAHKGYLEWNAIAKLDDIEEKHEAKLDLAKHSLIKMIGENYVRQNRDMQYNPERAIGGGRNKIKAINMKGVAKTAGKVKNMAFGKSSGKSPRVASKRVVEQPRSPSRRHKFAISIKMGKN